MTDKSTSQVSPPVPAVLSSATAAQDGPVLVHLSEVEPEPVSWLWPGRVARGKLNFFIGDPGTGKSYLTLDVIARVTRGTQWPDGGQAPQGKAILLSAEDGIADTIRPRVDGLGGDPTRVWVLEAVRQKNKERPFSLQVDLPALEQALVNSQVDLVVIDPVTAYLGKIDYAKDPDVRSVLTPLGTVAKKHGVAVVAVMHLNKAEQMQVIHRAGGSMAFVGIARAVSLVAKDPTDEDRKFFTPIKLNIGKMPAALAFRITDDLRIQWEPEPAKVDAEAVLSGKGQSKDQAELDRAKEFLRELLHNGPVLAKEVLQTAEDHRIAERTLYRAKEALGVISRRLGGIAGSWAWAWALREGGKIATKAAKGSELATLSEIPASKGEMSPENGKIAKVAKAESLAVTEPSPDPQEEAPADYEIEASQL